MVLVKLTQELVNGGRVLEFTVRRNKSGWKIIGNFIMKKANRLVKGFCVIAVLFFVFNNSVRAAEEDVPYERHIDVYWTDTPPVLDGKMDDACWQDAEVASDFRRFSNKTEAAYPQTEVRVCYDADYLYLHYRCFDDNIEELRVGSPDDARDEIDVNKDVVELFLDPGRTKTAYFQFCTTPLGARFDLRVTPEQKRELGLYTPEWTVAPHIGKDEWSVEIRIPYSELVFDGGFIGTPQVGEEWGINFCRDQGYRKEWTYWSPTRDRSFHRPGQIGVAVFKGRKSGARLPDIRWEDGVRLFYGSGLVKLISDEPGTKATWEVRHDRKPDPTAGKASGNDGMGFNFNLMEGGEWDIRVRANLDGQSVFSGRGVVKLPLIKKLITSINDSVQTGLKKLQKADSPELKQLWEQANILSEQVGPLADKLENPKKLTSKEWSELAARMPDIEAQWNPVRYDLEVLRFYPEEGTPHFAVAHAGPSTLIMQDTIIAPVEQPVEIYGAGNEYESFQLVLMPFWQNVENVEVSFPVLEGPGGTIPVSAFEYNVVGYVKMHEAWGGYWTPDVLYPDKPVSLSKNQTQPLWINLFIPPGTKEGDYRGEITLRAGEQTAKVPVVLHAFGFDIPERRSVSTDPWYWLDGGRFWRKYYQVDEMPFTPELYEKHLKTLAKYRYACYPLSSDVIWRQLKMYRNPDGSVRFDFSPLDFIWELGRKYGADNLGASGGCNFNSMRPAFSGRLEILDPETGEKVSSPGSYNKDIAAWEYTYRVTGKTDFIANPIYRQFLKQWVAFLREKNLLENSHFEIYDEPKTGNEWQELLQMHGWLKQFVPDLKLKSYGVGPWNYEDRPEWSPIGSYDVWAPGLNAINPQRLEELQARQEEGEESWFYTCGAGYRDVDRKTRPHICLYQHPLAPRMHGWAAWKLKVDGFLIFALMNGIPENVQEDPDKYYSEPVWESNRTAGQGYLVYPGDDKQLWPSIRLSSVRDGLEDYEYFKVLSDCREKLDPKKNVGLILEIDEELEVPEDILPWDWYEWTHEISKLNAKRSRMAELILRAKAAVVQDQGTETRKEK